MQQAINILLAEDELLVLEDLKELLEEAGYTSVFKAKDYQQATEILKNTPIDLALLDINLGNGKTGVDIGDFINNNFKFPFIYITSYSDNYMIQYLKPTKPSAFLVKPYSRDVLLASIEIALFNFSANLNAAETIPASESGDDQVIINQHLIVKENYRFIKIPLGNILWFESDKNYITVKTAHKKYLIRSSLKKLSEQLPSSFVKCYKQFIINVKHVDTFTPNSVHIAGHEIPISRHTQEEVLRRLKSNL